MYNPATSESHDEFIEIHNLSDNTIDLTGWYLADSSASDGLVDFGQGLLLAAKQFAVILDGSYPGNSNTYDTIIPDLALVLIIDNSTFGSGALTNTVSKTIFLYNSLDSLMDSYKYQPNYANGHSDEKILLEAGNDVSNWTASFTEGGSPGQVNTVSQPVMSSNSIHINEIKFLASSGEPEWLELFNSGDTAISLFRWAIADLPDTTQINVSQTILPGEYMIISADTGLGRIYGIEEDDFYKLNNFPSLNNDKDVLSLIDPFGETIEQVPYEEAWLEGDDWRNPSLERINIQLDPGLARNWGPSVSAMNATPGEKNSIQTAIGKELNTRISISPNPFSPNSDGIDDFSIIRVELPVNSARIKVEIYDVLGRKVTTLKDNTYSASTSEITWNGKDKSGRVMRMGVYIIYIQILNDRDGVLKEIKETVVVAGKL